MRKGVWLWLCLALGLGFGVYELKLRVQSLEQRLADTNRSILADEEAIHVLKAEWSYLNEPTRIDALARKYLGLVPLAGSQFGTYDDLPRRLQASESAAPFPPVPVERPKLARPNRVTLAREVQ